ncbi:hypothetical protein LINGRAHAP2_LOCUS513, partial [Linum grandiflorum]
LFPATTTPEVSEISDFSRLSISLDEFPQTANPPFLDSRFP